MAKTYVIKAGDSLSKIAGEFLGDASKWKDIYEANKDVISDPNVITPGVEIKIPGEDKPKKGDSRGHFE